MTALGLGLVVAPSAQAVVPVPVVLFADSLHSYSLYSGDLDGANATQVTTGGMVTNYVEASADGQVLAIQGMTGDDNTPAYDATDGLIVSVQGATSLLATSTEANPVVSSDGAHVWFSAKSNLYSWTRATGLVTQLTTDAPLTPPATPAGQPTESLWGLAVSADGTTAAGIFRAVTFTAASTKPTATRSILKAFTLPATSAAASTTVFTSTAYSGATGPELFFDAPRFAGTSLVFGECVTGACDDWKYKSVDLSAVTPVPVATAGDLDNTYDLRLLDDGVNSATWYAWEDGASATSYKTSTDLTGPWVVGGSRPDGQTSLGFVPVRTAPTAFSSRQSSAGAAAVQAHLDLSTSLVKTGGQAVYASYAFYLKGLAGQTWNADAGITQRGTIQYSTDGGRTWLRLTTTTSKTVVAWPGGTAPDGNGRTQKLTRNTWFRWLVPSDVFVRSATTSVRLVRVSPTVKAKVVKSGSKRTVSGTVARIGGSAVLYKGTKKIATVKVSSRGVYSFGKRALSRGTYRVVTIADVSWAAGSLTVKI